jgi:parvulin-like peptidyl-prolyl isomerase
MESATRQEVSSTFGGEFATSVEEAPVGQWTGPVQSGFGLHLVRVDRRDPGKAPTLAEIRPLVQREWEAAQRKSVNEAFLARLEAKYDIRIEGRYGELMAMDGKVPASRAHK